jgi:hypothetical protein
VDSLPVDRPGAPQRLLAARGEHGETRPAVGLIGLAFGQPRGGQLVHDPAHPGPAEHGALAQLAHPQPAVRGGVQLQQHVIPGQRHLARGPQVGLDRGHQPAVRHQQPPPRVHRGIPGRAPRSGAFRCFAVLRRAAADGAFRRVAVLRRAAAREIFRHGRQPSICVRARAHILCACARSLLIGGSHDPDRVRAGRYPDR